MLKGNTVMQETTPTIIEWQVESLTNTIECLVRIRELVARQQPVSIELLTEGMERVYGIGGFLYYVKEHTKR